MHPARTIEHFLASFKNKLSNDFGIHGHVNKDAIITGITCDSRKVQKGFVFFAIPGNKTDGSEFISQAIQQGACLVLKPSDSTVPIRKLYAETAAWFFDYPQQKMKCIGITGTSGKTTTTFLLQHLLQESGLDCALMGTIENRFRQFRESATHTTGDAADIFSMLSRFIEMGAKFCVMEVSSHALDQDRVHGIDFAQTGFLNLSPEHLDYHSDMEEYFQSKKKLFLGTGKKFAMTDNPWGQRLVGETGALGILNGIQNFQSAVSGCSGRFHDLPFHCVLGGSFQKQNLELATAMALDWVQNPAVVVHALKNFAGVPGRMQKVLLETQSIKGATNHALAASSQLPTVYVDYAHKPEALEKVLQSVREACDQQNGKLIVVFGCGGDRDRSKRPKMGRIAAEIADLVTITSDNPRSENPETILDEILAGVPAPLRSKVLRISDRAAAIEKAIQSANANDLVIIAGKGHEKVQIFSGHTILFDDFTIAEGYLTTYSKKR